MKIRKFIRSLLLILLLGSLVCIPKSTLVVRAMSGDGSEGNPWVVMTDYDLQAIQNNLGDWYELGQDIDASGTETWNEGAGFVPITAFTGHLDGMGYVISDIFVINDVDRNKQHAIFYATAGTIQNLGVENATVRGDEKSGILVGVNTGTVQRCYVTGTLDKAVSGSKGKNLGGLIGNNKGIVVDCYAIVDVTGNEKSGGITGKQESGTVTNVYAAGTVTAGATAFGFNGEIRNVDGNTFSDCFWDTDVGPATDSAAAELSTPVGKTTAQMKQEATFTNWDFVDTWEIVEDTSYPTLQVFATGATPDITNLPIDQDFGIVLETDVYETGLTYFTVTNNSGAAITIYISGTDATGGTTHTLSDTATPGNNIFGLKAGLEGGDYTIIVKKSEAFNTLCSGLADEAAQKWGLRLYTPTTFTNEDAQKTFTVTLSVVLD